MLTYFTDEVNLLCRWHMCFFNQKHAKKDHKQPYFQHVAASQQDKHLSINMLQGIHITAI